MPVVLDRHRVGELLGLQYLTEYSVYVTRRPEFPQYWGRGYPNTNIEATKGKPALFMHKLPSVLDHKMHCGV
jgi:hypothetical protein